MGYDKALLPVAEGVLVQRVAARVRAAAGSVTLIGDPNRYEHLGYPVVADVFPGQGPLAGIHTALLHTAADWNLVVACDMPDVSTELMQQLLDAAARSDGAAAVVPQSSDGRLAPVCAVYHRSVLAAAEQALANGQRRLLDLVERLAVIQYPIDSAGQLRNINTPQEWAAYAG